MVDKNIANSGRVPAAAGKGTPGECTRLVLDIEGRRISEILGHPDDLKFQSSMTLFMVASPNEPIFSEALDKYYGGASDLLTLRKLGMGQRVR